MIQFVVWAPCIWSANQWGLSILCLRPMTGYFLPVVPSPGGFYVTRTISNSLSWPSWFFPESRNIAVRRVCHNHQLRKMTFLVTRNDIDYIVLAFERYILVGIRGIQLTIFLKPDVPLIFHIEHAKIPSKIIKKRDSDKATTRSGHLCWSIQIILL